MKRRKCSICHLPGHDRRSHEKRNPQFRMTASGVRYPIRGTDGPGGKYDVYKSPSDENRIDKSAKKAYRLRQEIESLVRRRETVQSSIRSLDRQKNGASHSKTLQIDKHLKRMNAEDSRIAGRIATMRKRNDRARAAVPY